MNDVTNEQLEIPKGYMQDAVGRLVPTKRVSDHDKARDKLVKRLVQQAKRVQAPLAEFKRDAMDAVQTFIEESAKTYNARVGGKKGNVTLYSYDGRLKITRTFAENIYFDERLQASKTLVDECIHQWVKGSRTEIKALVEQAFQTDKQGNISISRIIGLKRLDIQDAKWQQAMQALTDSMQVAGTKPYLRVYERIGDTDAYKAIPLDIAAL